MQHLGDNEYEQRLRTAFEPDSQAIDRVVAAAMKPGARRPKVLRVVVALALTGVVLVWLFLSLQPSPVRADSARLEYVGDVALLKFSDGSCLVLSPDPIREGRSSNLNIIIIGGEKP